MVARRGRWGCEIGLSGNLFEEDVVAFVVGGEDDDEKWEEAFRLCGGDVLKPDPSRIYTALGIDSKPADALKSERDHSVAFL